MSAVAFYTETFGIQYGEEDRGFYLESYRQDKSSDIEQWEERPDELIIELQPLGCARSRSEHESLKDVEGISSSQVLHCRENPGDNELGDILSHSVESKKSRFALELAKKATFLSNDEKAEVLSSLKSAEAFGAFLKFLKVFGIGLGLLALMCPFDGVLYRVVLFSFGLLAYTTCQIARKRVERYRLLVEMHLVRLT